MQATTLSSSDNATTANQLLPHGPNYIGQSPRLGLRTTKCSSVQMFYLRTRIDGDLNVLFRTQYRSPRGGTVISDTHN